MVAKAEKIIRMT